MKINGPGGIDAIKAYTAHMQNEKLEVQKKPAEVRKDVVEISAQSRRVQSYLSKLEKLPEVRDDLVASLKKKIQEGTFQTDSQKIAAGIIQEAKLDRMV